MTLAPCAGCGQDISVPNPKCPHLESHGDGVAQGGTPIAPDLGGDIISWGVVRNEAIHMACATPEEHMLTWGSFEKAKDGAGKKCARCGGSLDGPRLP